MGKDIGKIKHLFEHAFPSEERPPFSFFYYTPRQDLKGVYDEDTFIGLVDTIEYQDVVYLFFLALKKKYRQKGYGSTILKDLFSRFPNKRIYLLAEEIDEKYPNYEERISRLSFYKKNGMYPTSTNIDEYDIVYTLLSNNTKVTYQDHMKIMDYLLEDSEYRFEYKKHCFEKK